MEKVELKTEGELETIIIETENKPVKIAYESQPILSDTVGVYNLIQNISPKNTLPEGVNFF
jgi:hypothetical protein